MGAIPAEIFESRHYGTVMLAAILGGAGVLYGAAGSYSAAFWIARRAASCRC